MKMEKWNVSKCLNCDCNIFAVADDETGNVLINGKMLRDKNYLVEMIKKNDNYSMPFKIILKSIDLLPNTTMKSTINDDAHIKHLFGKLQDFIAKDKSETENEIRKLTLAMSQRRQQAEKEFQLIVTLINSIESSEKIENSTILESTNDNQSISMTPPITTPDAQLTIDPIVKIPHRDREGIAKHNNAILHKQVLTRNINFEDDDIFELDIFPSNKGIKDEPANENDRYHKYSDTEEGSEGEEEMIIEKRPFARGRSGSTCIARSAPISMPQFLHHNNPQFEDKNVNDQHDIASSIKLLAKSIHADSIFGELPVRPVFKYNAEF